VINTESLAGDGKKNAPLQQPRHRLLILLDRFDLVKLERLRLPVHALFAATNGSGKSSFQKNSCKMGGKIEGEKRNGKGASDEPDWEEPSGSSVKGECESQYPLCGSTRQEKRENVLDEIMPAFQLSPIPSQLVLQLHALAPPRPRRRLIEVKQRVLLLAGVGGLAGVVEEEGKNVAREMGGNGARFELGGESGGGARHVSGLGVSGGSEEGDDAGGEEETSDVWGEGGTGVRENGSRNEKEDMEHHGGRWRGVSKDWESL
jgi:hypothetical protein